jgi:hypothetical protein
VTHSTKDSKPDPKPDPGWRLELQDAAPAWELVAFGADAASPPVNLPAAPGAMTLDAQGRPALLHFAPGRWLALADPTGTSPGSAIAAFDVTGKWQGLVLSGPRAPRLLASTIHTATVLRARDCAALELFDCPAILAALPDGGAAPAYAVWVLSSYLAQFLDAAQRAPLEPRNDL